MTTEGRMINLDAREEAPGMLPAVLQAPVCCQVNSRRAEATSALVPSEFSVQ